MKFVKFLTKLFFLAFIGRKIMNYQEIIILGMKNYIKKGVFCGTGKIQSRNCNY